MAGIAAPARGDACRNRAGETFDCGGAATAALTRLVTGRPVSCRIVGQDGFGRGLGQCESGGTDLGRTLVGNGFAVATAATLRPAETAARDAGQGLWAHPAGAPADWRTRN
nr:thermonuclease family protein [Neoroseomonas eburnea]